MATNNIELEDEACAVVFSPDGSFHVYIPTMEQGEQVTPQVLYTLLVQELLKDQFMIKVLVDRLIESGMMGSPVEEAADA